MATKTAFYEECDKCKHTTRTYTDWTKLLDELVRDKWQRLTQPSRSVCGACIAKMTPEERMLLGIVEEKKP